MFHNFLRLVICETQTHSQVLYHLLIHQFGRQSIAFVAQEIFIEYLPYVRHRVRH